MIRMRRLTFVILVGLTVAVSASSASAQTERRAGLVIAYPGSVGIEWQAASRLALRIDGDYNQSSHEATSDFGFGRFLPSIPGLPVIIPESFEIATTTTLRDVDLGLSLLFDLRRSEQLRVYVAPRIGVNFARTTTETEFGGDARLLAALTVPADSETSSTSPSGGVALGASRDVSERFRLFGETGFHYVRGDFGGGIGTDVKSSAFGLRAGVGAVILF